MPPILNRHTGSFASESITHPLLNWVDGISHLGRVRLQQILITALHSDTLVLLGDMLVLLSDTLILLDECCLELDDPLGQLRLPLLFLQEKAYYMALAPQRWHLATEGLENDCPKQLNIDTTFWEIRCHRPTWILLHNYCYRKHLRSRWLTGRRPWWNRLGVDIEGQKKAQRDFEKQWPVKSPSKLGEDPDTLSTILDTISAHPASPRDKRETGQGKSREKDGSSWQQI
jgi:hypothetical protein